MEKSIIGNAAPVSKASRRAGWIISGILIAFFLFDAAGKIAMEAHSVSGSTELGWPASAIRGIGIALLVSTVFYAFPKTAPIGAILLTGYVGGAMAIMIRAGKPLYFTLIFELLVWVGIALRDGRVKRLFIG